MSPSSVPLSQVADEHRGVRATYEAPRLLCLGDVRDLTLGGSPGTGDSSSAGTEQF